MPKTTLFWAESRAAGFEVAMKGLDGGRLFIAACCVGLAYRLTEDAADYANQGSSLAYRFRVINLSRRYSPTTHGNLRGAGMVESAARRVFEGQRITCEASM
jgi:acyl-CoA dehydrogenase